jgi:hypothetical protein
VPGEVALVVERVEANIYRTIDLNIANPMTNPPKDLGRRGVTRYWVYFVRSDTGGRLVYDSPRWYEVGEVQRARPTRWWERLLSRGERLRDPVSGRTVRLVFL